MCVTPRNNFTSDFFLVELEKDDRQGLGREGDSQEGVINWAGVQNTISEPKNLRYMMTMLNDILT